MSSVAEMMTRLETATVNYTKSDPLTRTEVNKSLIKIRRQLKKDSAGFGLQFAEMGGTRALLNVLKVYTGKLVMETLVLVLCHQVAISEVTEAAVAQELFELMFRLSYHTDTDEAVYAVPLLTLLLGLVPDSYTMAHVAATTASNAHVSANDDSANGRPYGQLVTTDADAINFLIDRVCLLNALARASAVTGQSDTLVAQLEAVGVAVFVDSAVAGLPVAEFEEKTELLAELDELRVFCHLEKESAKTSANKRALWKARQRAFHLEAKSTMSRGLGQQASAVGAMNKLAGVSMNEGGFLGSLEQYVQRLHAQMESKMSESLEKQEKQARQQLEKLESLQYHIAELEALKPSEEEAQERQEMLASFRVLKAITEEKQEIQMHSNTHAFYQSTEIKLNEVMLGYKVLATGMVVAKAKQDAFAVAQKFINLAGDCVPFPGVSAVTSIVSAAMTWRRGKQQTKEIKRNNIAVSITAMEEISERVARRLTQRYFEQLRQLSDEGARTLGECGVRRMLEAMRVGQAESNAKDEGGKVLVQQLLECTGTIEGKQGVLPFTNKTILRIIDASASKFQLSQHGKWNESGIFRKSGLMTPNGRKFVSKVSKIVKYGFRTGTEEEALRLKMVEQKSTDNSLTKVGPKSHQTEKGDEYEGKAASSASPADSPTEMPHNVLDLISSLQAKVSTLSAALEEERAERLKDRAALEVERADRLGDQERSTGQLASIMAQLGLDSNKSKDLTQKQTASNEEITPSPNKTDGFSSSVADILGEPLHH